MFSIDNEMNITITKGDSAVIRVEFENYTMASGDTLTFTARRRVGSAVLMSATSSTQDITLTATNTKNLEVGCCVYDIELHTSDGGVYTVVGVDNVLGYSNMAVLPEVTE